MKVTTNSFNLSSTKNHNDKTNKLPVHQVSFKGNAPEVFRIWNDHGHNTSAYHSFSWGYRVTPDDISTSFDFDRVINQPRNDDDRNTINELSELLKRIGFKDIRESGNLKHDGVLLSNLSGIGTLNNDTPGMSPVQDQISTTLETLDMCAKKGPKCKTLAVCQPGFATADEIDYLIKTYNKTDNENRIYGLKFHSRYLNIRPSDHRYDPFFDVAEKHGLPCYLHTDPWGAAEGLDLFQLAKRHPKVATVFVHMTSNSGQADNFKAHRQKTIDEAKKLLYKQNNNGEFEKDNNGRLIPKESPDADIYLETAWCGFASDDAIMALREAGPDRVIYGSDMPLGPTQDPLHELKFIKDVVKGIVDNEEEFKNRWGCSAKEVVSKYFHDNTAKLMARAKFPNAAIKFAGKNNASEKMLSFSGKGKIIDIGTNLKSTYDKAHLNGTPGYNLPHNFYDHNTYRSTEQPYHWNALRTMIAITGILPGHEVMYALVANESGLGADRTQDELRANNEITQACNSYTSAPGAVGNVHYAETGSGFDGSHNRLLPLAIAQPSSGTPTHLKFLWDRRSYSGIKFNPAAEGITPDNEKYDSYVELASEKGKPCFFVAEPQKSEPESIYALAKRHPEVPMIIINAKKDAETIKKEGRKAIDVIKEANKNGDANLFLETAWLPPEMVVTAIKEIGWQRVLFGSDGVQSGRLSQQEYANNITEIEVAIKSDPELSKNADGIIDRIFCQNAEDLILKNNHDVSKWIIES